MNVTGRIHVPINYKPTITAMNADTQTFSNDLPAPVAHLAGILGIDLDYFATSFFRFVAEKSKKISRPASCAACANEPLRVMKASGKFSTAIALCVSTRSGSSCAKSPGADWRCVLRSWRSVGRFCASRNHSVSAGQVCDRACAVWQAHV